MNVLLVWENTEVGVELYLIDNPSEDELDVLNRANGEFVNYGYEYDAEGSIYLVSEAVRDNSTCYEHQSWIGKWMSKRKSTPIKEKIDLVIHCGICG